MKDACEWRRVDVASGKSATVASFPGTCVGGRIAWSADGKIAAAWFDPRNVVSAGIGGSEIGKPGYEDEKTDEAAKPRLFSITVATGMVKALPAPSFELDEVGVDAKGDVLVLSLDELEDADVKAGKTIVDGKALALSPVEEGQPALAHAWRLEGETWKRAETKQTTTGWDYGMGVRELDAWKALGPRSSQLLDTHLDDSKDVDEETMKRLAPITPKYEGSWAAFGNKGARVFAWVISGEFAHTTGLVALEGAKAAPKIGFTDGEFVAVRTRGTFGLISSGNAGAHPRAYELTSATAKWSSDTARAVSFWPQ